MGIQLQHQDKLLHRTVKDVLDSQIRPRPFRGQPVRHVSSNERQIQQLTLIEGNRGVGDLQKFHETTWCAGFPPPTCRRQFCSAVRA